MTDLTRRGFTSLLAGGLTAAVLPKPVFAATSVDLAARPGKARLVPDGYPETAIWGFDGQVPGPIIRVRQGEPVSRRFLNRLSQPSTVHWHGVRIDNAMDGVPDLTQSPVAAGDAFHYDFRVPDAGTYWYHPHTRSYEQMARGLYGALIVEEPQGAPEVDRDEVLLIDDWRLTETAQIADGFDNIHDWAHAGRIGNWITVNGDGRWRTTVSRNTRLRLRLVNVANARIFALATRGLEGWVVALDGMPLDAPQPLDSLVLAPAQRADLIVDVTAEDGKEAALVSRDRDGAFKIATFAVDGEARAERLATPKALPANPVAAFGALSSARKADLLMEGGAMGGMRGAMMGGRMMGIQQMAQAGKIWAFNGMADLPREPLIAADRGETIRIAITNDTAWPHAMHLHGHHFRQVMSGGSLGPLRDTLLMERGDKAEIAFVADNPGDWLLHCHMLEHAAGGMMTWIRVA
ncbi:multicopper oxidase family protein [Amorphus sp. 3PC139-8]|uniref:multicopper oxidase family protein n=1 Tax=Amorphus sp. 3PC139-8 TaxID=2735676 RepID=UPI00345C62D4